MPFDRVTNTHYNGTNMASSRCGQINRTLTQLEAVLDIDTKWNTFFFISPTEVEQKSIFYRCFVQLFTTFLGSLHSLISSSSSLSAIIFGVVLPRQYADIGTTPHLIYGE